MREIAPDKGYDHDDKYSNYRRYGPKALTGDETLYCTDIDWIEWRHHQPVGVVEVSRTFGYLDARSVYDEWCNRRKGFQREVCQYLALKLEVPLYFVVIDDPEPESETYHKATFHVIQVDPAPVGCGTGEAWLNGPRKFVTKYVGKFDHGSYISVFLATMWRRYAEFQDKVGLDQEAV